MGRSGLVSDADATSQPLIGAEIADLTARTRKLESQATTDKSTGALSVEVDSVVGYQDSKHGLVIPIIRYLISGDVQVIKTVIIKRSEAINQGTYESLRIPSKDSDITNAQREAGSVDLPFGPLEPLTVYDVLRVVAKDSFGGFVENPIFEPTYDPHPADGSGPADLGYPLNVLLTFTTVVGVSQAGAPGMPTLARVLANAIDPLGDGTLAIIRTRCFADETELLSFGEQQTVAVQTKLLKVGVGHTQYDQLIDDPTLLFVDFTIGDLEVGAEYDHVKNTAVDNEGLPTPAPATTTVALFAGGFRDPSDHLALLAFTNLNAVSQNGGTSERLKWRLTQPGPVFPGAGPYRLLSYFVEFKLFADPVANYVECVPFTDIRAPQFNTPGDILIKHVVPTVSGTAYQFRMTVSGTGGETKQFESGSITP